MLKIENLTKMQHGVPLLSNVNTVFPTAGLHVVTGDNGSGKTTLLKCVAGLERHGGRIRWLGGSPQGAVAAAFDDCSAHPTLTGTQNLSALLDLPRKESQSHPLYTAFLSRVLLGKRTKSYSLGQRKKLKLTEVFMSSRPCILLDEPLSGLDGNGREAFRKVLADSKRVKCIILVDHELAFYDDLSPSVYLMNQGQLLPVNGGISTIDAVV